jgi:hypothetical protein
MLNKGKHATILRKTCRRFYSRGIITTLKEESKHTTAALRKAQSRRSIGPPAKPKVPAIPPSKTSKTTNGHEVEGKNLQTPEKLTVKTSKTPEPAQLGLITAWSAEFGYVSLHDPTTGEWHDLKTTVAPEWAVGEARRRKELYKTGNRRAYRLSARDMEEVWKSDRPPEVGTVEDYPVEGA